eukprot:TRINITY_DN41936_c0_g1_i2.p1 TRINITY_DN41936_c0_g1~~TRINITY_DN41936_c0_g1_i2.p1  ORF type:complete len:448 (-),score=162.73 TRINITY_DN41936_c0_g1_i2:106-1413(-)
MRKRDEDGVELTAEALQRHDGDMSGKLESGSRWPVKHGAIGGSGGEDERREDVDEFAEDEVLSIGVLSTKSSFAPEWLKRRTSKRRRLLFWLKRVMNKNTMVTLLLLWRSPLMKLIKGLPFDARAIRRLSIMSLLLLSSHKGSRVWKWIRKRLGLSMTGQKAIILALLQWPSRREGGECIPVIITMIDLAYIVLGAWRRLFEGNWWMNEVVQQGLMSGTLMLALQENNMSIFGPYRNFLNMACGPPNPVLLRPTPETSSSFPAFRLHEKPTFAAALRHALDMNVYLPHIRHSIPAVAKMWVFMYLVIKPLIGGRRPNPVWAVFQGLRSATWIALSASIGVLCGRFNVAKRPLTTTALRFWAGAVGSLLAWLEGVKEMRPIYAFLWGNVIHSALHILGRLSGLPIVSIMTLLWPLLGLFGVVHMAPITRSVVKSLQ